MRIRSSLIITTVALVAAITIAHGQDKPARLTFDVASVKQAAPNQPAGGIKAMPGGQEYVAQGAPVRLMISLMYKIPLRQIEGGPDWMNTELYDVDAKADGSYNLDDLHTMFQNLLADRFLLKFHKDVREGNVFALTVDKSGLKMKPNDSPQDFNIPIIGGPNFTFTGKRVPMEYLCWTLGQFLQADQRPVIDKTGLKGNYDFTLSFMPELPPGVTPDRVPAELQNRPSIFDALKEQLGLRLDATKGPVEYFVIDHIERPAAN